MEIRPIRTEADYRAAIAEIDRLIDAAEGTPEADRLDVLSTLVEAYEDGDWPTDPADPIEVIKFMMEQNDLSQADLVPMIGSRARVSEVLNRKRHLTLPMIWRLSTRLGIPADALVSPYALAGKRQKAPARRTGRPDRGSSG